MKNRKEKIENSFDKKAHSYNRHASLQKKSAQNLCQLLPNTQPLKILEIGCGTGFLTEELQKIFPNSEIIGIDISKNMVASCQQKFTGHSNLNFQVMDGENINLDQKFDLIISNLSIQWFENPVTGLRKLCGNLTDGGALYFSTIGNKSFWQWQQILEELNLPSGILKSPSYDGIFTEEEEIITYKNAIDFLQNFKKIGAQQPREKYKPLSTKNLKKACSTFDTAHNGCITWHILYGCLDASGNAFFKRERKSIQSSE